MGAALFKGTRCHPPRDRARFGAGYRGRQVQYRADQRKDENALSEAPLREGVAELLAHEYVHSWNGKYRRPAGLLSSDYQQPMDDSLLWVYEGLTQFWGTVLPVRAGLDAAIAAAHETRKPIELMVESGDYYRTLGVAHFDGALPAPGTHRGPPRHARTRC